MYIKQTALLFMPCVARACVCAHARVRICVRVSTFVRMACVRTGIRVCDCAVMHWFGPLPRSVRLNV